MKKLKIWSIMIIMVLPFLFACSSNNKKAEELNMTEDPKPKSLEEIADSNLQKAIEELVPQSPDYIPEISKKNRIFYDDSIYVAAFTMKYKNQHGGFSRDRFQYIVSVQDSVTCRYLLTLSKEELSDFLMLYTDALNQPQYKGVQGDSLAERHLLHKLGVLYCITYEGGLIKDYRKVEGQKHE